MTKEKFTDIFNPFHDNRLRMTNLGNANRTANNSNLILKGRTSQQIKEARETKLL